MSASTPTSTSSARPSGTNSTARCSTRSTRFSGRSSKVPEHAHHAVAATRNHRVVYASNHKSHIDYLVEPIVLDDAGVRPPLIAAGINLFGGPLGLLHRHITGAIPIRRSTKDPAYLITLKAYIAEILKKHDLFFYPEGGRSYSGELKMAKTGLLHAALTAERAEPGDRPGRGRLRSGARRSHPRASRASRKSSGRSRASSPRWCATPSATGRASFVTFGPAIPVTGCDPQSRSDVLALTRLDPVAHRGAAQGAADGAVCIGDAAVDHPARSRSPHRSADRRACRPARPTSASPRGRQAVEEAAELLETRGIVVHERGRFRVRDRSVLRYYARTIEHLLATPGRTH